MTGGWNSHIVHEAIREPIPISLAVLGAGFLFRLSRPYLKSVILKLENTSAAPLLICILIVFLGLISSIITAIIAALVLVEVIHILNYSRKAEIYISIIGCFSIGLGAALTPIGEPLSTIVVSKLNVDFWYLLLNFGVLIIPAILLLGILSPWFLGKHLTKSDEIRTGDESLKTLIVRAVKVYVFVAALICLGQGFKPIVDTYVAKLSSPVLYFLNLSSAILDNATLAAAEVSPTMTLIQLKSILMALLISGGMLIPGNIPNIIVANKLGIKSREWAKFGIPLGAVFFIGYFIILEIL